MTATEFINQLKALHFNVQDDPSVPILQETQLETRCLRSAQGSVNWLWPKRPWQWRRGAADGVAVTAYGATLSTDFGTSGPDMAVYRESDGVELRPRPVQTLRRLISTQPNTTTKPKFYAISVSIAGGSLLAYPGGTDTLSIEDYFRVPPTLVNQASDASLAEVPEQYHDSILWKYAVADLMLPAGDARRETVLVECEQLVKEAWADENMTPNVQRVPRYGRGYLYRV